MTLIFDLCRRRHARITRVTQDIVVEILLVVDLLDNLTKALWTNSSVALSILQWTYAETFAKK